MPRRPRFRHVVALPLVSCAALALLAVAGLASPRKLQAASAIGPAAGRFLVARSELPDPNFFEAVVLLLDYDGEQGAVGVVVNRRTSLTVGETATSDPLSERTDPLYLGGPVALGTVLVLLSSGDPPDGASQVIPGVHLIRDDASLRELVESDPAQESVRFYAGYAGWAPGQLESEIERGVWHLLPGDARWVFNDAPGRTWERLMRIVFGRTA